MKGKTLKNTRKYRIRDDFDHFQNTHQINSRLVAVFQVPVAPRTVFEQLADLLAVSDEFGTLLAQVLLDSLKDVPDGGSALVSQLFGTAELANTEQHIAVKGGKSATGREAKIFSMLFKYGNNDVIMISMPSAPVVYLHKTDFKVG